MKDYIIIGAGQAGLAMAYYLNKQKANYLVIDANSEIGAPWLKRWDSLKLFTPSEFNNLPGMKFPHKKGHYADKYEVAKYLKSYVKKFDIPVAFNQKVNSLKKESDYFIVKGESQIYKTKNVIVATGPFHTPFTPPAMLIFQRMFFKYIVSTIKALINYKMEQHWLLELEILESRF